MCCPLHVDESHRQTQMSKGPHNGTRADGRGRLHRRPPRGPATRRRFLDLTLRPIQDTPKPLSVMGENRFLCSMRLETQLPLPQNRFSSDHHRFSEPVLRFCLEYGEVQHMRCHQVICCTTLPPPPPPAEIMRDPDLNLVPRSSPPPPHAELHAEVPADPPSSSGVTASAAQHELLRHRRLVLPPCQHHLSSCPAPTSSASR